MFPICRYSNIVWITYGKYLRIYVYVYICMCVYMYIYMYVYIHVAVVIVDVGRVNGLMLWWLVWLANRFNDRIKTHVDTREITYCYLSMCIDALYRNPVMYAEPQWSGCRSACKLLVEMVSHKKSLLPTETILIFQKQSSQFQFLSTICNTRFYALFVPYLCRGFEKLFEMGNQI
jgi:hypothetical protein